MSESNASALPPASPPPSSAKTMDEIMSLCKRRGFIYQASEIYGGINGFWDYGPLGAQLKKNLREAWWQDMIMLPCWGRSGPGGEKVRCVPVETCIIQNPKVWEASGHVGGFNDPMVDCRETKQRFRADKAWVVGFYNAEDHNRLSAIMQSFSAQHLELWIELTQQPLDENDHYVPDAGWTQRQRQYEAAKTQELAGALPTVMVAVVADNIHEALAIAAGQLSKPQRRRLHAVASQYAFNQLNLPSLWPRLSPATQQPTLTEPRQFNLMFKTYIGATAGEDDIAYLRPETAQGVFVQFKNVVDTTRVKVPFGIGNTGKSFRNEVTPRNFTFRSREFEQMELEFFCHPDESQAWYKFWRDFRMEWWQSIGLKGDNLILREHEKDELSHYSVGTSDVEYRFPFTAPGFGELEGIAHRGNYDLTQHQKHSGAKLEYFDQERGELLPNGSHKGERFLPHCIEPAAGLDRGVLAILCESYTKDPSRPSPEIMRFHPRLAPIKAGVFPLVNKDGMPEVAEKLHAELQGKFGREGFIETDAKQSIGRRYARMDEAGCPFCFTIDGDTLTGQTVTVRDRDTGAQERIAIDKVSGYLAEKLST